MARDIEDFLRKAAERRAQAQKAAKNKKGQAGQRPPAREKGTAVPNQPIQRPALSNEEAEPEVVSAVPMEPRRLSDKKLADAEPADRHVGSGSLGQKVKRSESKLESHLHETFDHKIGTLAASSDDSASLLEEPTTQSIDAQAIIQMFQSPESIRAAIIMKEVLERPEHRW